MARVNFTPAQRQAELSRTLRDNSLAQSGATTGYSFNTDSRGNALYGSYGSSGRRYSSGGSSAPVLRNVNSYYADKNLSVGQVVRSSNQIVGKAKDYFTPERVEYLSSNRVTDYNNVDRKISVLYSARLKKEEGEARAAAKAYEKYVSDYETGYAAYESSVANFNSSFGGKSLGASAYERAMAQQAELEKKASGLKAQGSIVQGQYNLVVSKNDALGVGSNRLQTVIDNLAKGQAIRNLATSSTRFDNYDFFENQDVGRITKRGEKKIDADIKKYMQLEQQPALTKQLLLETPKFDTFKLTPTQKSQLAYEEQLLGMGVPSRVASQSSLGQSPVSIGFEKSYSNFGQYDVRNFGAGAIEAVTLSPITMLENAFPFMLTPRGAIFKPNYATTNPVSQAYISTATAFANPNQVMQGIGQNPLRFGGNILGTIAVLGNFGQVAIGSKPGIFGKAYSLYQRTSDPLDYILSPAKNIFYTGKTRLRGDIVKTIMLGDAPTLKQNLQYYKTQASRVLGKNITPMDFRPTRETLNIVQYGDWGKTRGISDTGKIFIENIHRNALMGDIPFSSLQNQFGQSTSFTSQGRFPFIPVKGEKIPLVRGDPSGGNWYIDSRGFYATPNARISSKDIIGQTFPNLIGKEFGVVSKQFGVNLGTSKGYGQQIISQPLYDVTFNITGKKGFISPLDMTPGKKVSQFYDFGQTGKIGYAPENPLGIGMERQVNVLGEGYLNYKKVKGSGLRVFGESGELLNIPKKEPKLKGKQPSVYFYNIKDLPLFGGSFPKLQRGYEVSGFGKQWRSSALANVVLFKTVGRPPREPSSYRIAKRKRVTAIIPGELEDLLFKGTFITGKEVNFMKAPQPDIFLGGGVEPIKVPRKSSKYYQGRYLREILDTDTLYYKGGAKKRLVGEIGEEAGVIVSTRDLEKVGRTVMGKPYFRNNRLRVFGKEFMQQDIYSDTFKVKKIKGVPQPSDEIGFLLYKTGKDIQMGSGASAETKALVQQFTGIKSSKKSVSRYGLEPELKFYEFAPRKLVSMNAPEINAIMKKYSSGKVVTDIGSLGRPKKVSKSGVFDYYRRPEVITESKLYFRSALETNLPYKTKGFYSEPKYNYKQQELFPRYRQSDYKKQVNYFKEPRLKEAKLLDYKKVFEPSNNYRMPKTDYVNLDYLKLDEYKQPKYVPINYYKEQNYFPNKTNITVPRMPQVYKREKSIAVNDRTQLFIPYVRKNNNTKWVKVTDKPLPYNSAFNRGLMVADNTTARSVKLKRASKTFGGMDDPFIMEEKFRRRKARSRVPGEETIFVENTPYLLDSVGEIQGLRAAKYAKQQGSRNQWAF